MWGLSDVTGESTQEPRVCRKHFYNPVCRGCPDSLAIQQEIHSTTGWQDSCFMTTLNSDSTWNPGESKQQPLVVLPSARWIQSFCSFPSSLDSPSISGVLNVWSSPHGGWTRPQGSTSGHWPAASWRRAQVRHDLNRCEKAPPLWCNHLQLFLPFLCINLQLLRPSLMHTEDSGEATALYQCPQTCKWLYVEPSVSFLTCTVWPAFQFHSKVLIKTGAAEKKNKK